MKPHAVVLRALLIALPGACAVAAPPTVDQSAPGGGVHQAAPATATPAALSVTVAIATYGKLIVDAPPGAVCRAKAELPSGGVVLAGDFLIDHVANEVGQAIWTYRTPVAGAGAGTGSYKVSCVMAGRTADTAGGFEVP